jgi:hypothetical protein
MTKTNVIGKSDDSVKKGTGTCYVIADKSENKIQQQQ